MKRPVSTIASLATAALLASACSGAAAGRAEFTEICLDRFGNSQAKCACYVDALEAELSPEDFATLADGAWSHREYNSTQWLPTSVLDDRDIRSALDSATTSCLR